MTISGKAMVCGVMGNPVGHSLSPMMQNYFAEKLNLDFVYIPCNVPDEQVGEAIKGIYALGFEGINVTVPHKQRVMPYLLEIDEAARCIGAVNTLVRMEGGYKGYNTDAEGLFRAVKRQGIEVSGQDCLLLGAGGAAKAAAYMLMKHRARSVAVLNRSPEKARILADEMNRLFQRETMKAMDLSEYPRLDKDSYLAIQTTSVGMHPDIGYAVIEDPIFYENIHTAVDIIYTPAQTRFMELVKQGKGKAVNGLDMLIYQGIIAFELWNPDVRVTDQMTDEVRKMMEEQLYRQDGMERFKNDAEECNTHRIYGSRKNLCGKDAGKKDGP